MQKNIFYKPGVSKSGRACANVWGLFRRKPSRVRRGHLAEVYQAQVLRDFVGFPPRIAMFFSFLCTLCSRLLCDLPTHMTYTIVPYSTSNYQDVLFNITLLLIATTTAVH